MPTGATDLRQQPHGRPPLLRAARFHRLPCGLQAAAVRTAGAGVSRPTRFAIIAMGRFGGNELGYGSDADVLFVHEP
ncbi:hypothetical protein ABZ589_27705, partial [Streptomyces sp. NPDC013313]|uniref:hypothetical protein n=1 Tax=Streptomyces sp. NPDC013313 TaxID=3155603 RepID=UPI0033DF1FA3